MTSVRRTDIQEVAPNLFVGSQVDCERTGFAVVHAVKFPCFWRAVGERQPKPGDPGYLFTAYGRHLFLNLIDATDSRYFQSESFDIACRFIDARRGLGERVLVHCNQGRSRAPAIALVWMARSGEIKPDLLGASEDYIVRYPDFEPSRGLADFLIGHWDELVKERAVA